MTIAELISKLEKYPDDWRVELFWNGNGETADLTAEISDVFNPTCEKVVCIEASTIPLTDAEKRLLSKFDRYR